LFDLKGRNALITGASGAIGGGIARALHGAGATVVLSGTRRDPLDALASELGSRVHIAVANLADGSGVEGLVPAAEQALGGEVAILVNNAGVNRDMLFARMGDDDWQRVLDVNLTAPFRLTRAVLRGMMRARYGRIISISSVVVAVGNPGQANYSAAKAGIIGMTKSLAAEVASRNITVNCVAPGFVGSAMTDALSDKQRAAILERVPVKRLGTPAEIGAAVVFLASDEAAYVTGQTIHVNGGMAMI
jgi:3-oxoacyl-[acyl-carrier protein] reductase